MNALLHALIPSDAALRAHARHANGPHRRSVLTADCDESPRFDGLYPSEIARMLHGRKPRAERRPTPLQDRIVAMLRGGPLRTNEIVARTGLARQAVAAALARLVARGLVECVEVGSARVASLWRLRRAA